MDTQAVEMEWLTELVVILSNYQEEGLQLFPVVFISRSLESILKKLDGKDAIAVGSGPSTSQTIRKAFKQCAPLAEDRERASSVRRCFRRWGRDIQSSALDP